MAAYTRLFSKSKADVTGEKPAPKASDLGPFKQIVNGVWTQDKKHELTMSVLEQMVDRYSADYQQATDRYNQIRVQIASNIRKIKNISRLNNNEKRTLEGLFRQLATAEVKCFTQHNWWNKVTQLHQNYEFMHTEKQKREELLYVLKSINGNIGDDKDVAVIEDQILDFNDAAERIADDARQFAGNNIGPVSAAGDFDLESMLKSFMETEFGEAAESESTTSVVAEPSQPRSPPAVATRVTDERPDDDLVIPRLSDLLQDQGSLRHAIAEYPM